MSHLLLLFLLQAQAADAGPGEADGGDAAGVRAGAAGAQGAAARRRAVAGGRRRPATGGALLTAGYAKLGGDTAGLRLAWVDFGLVVPATA